MSRITEKALVPNYFCSMDPSVQFLLGNDAPTSAGATIHSIAPLAPESNDDGKIGFTLDVAARLDRDCDESALPEVIVPIIELARTRLADSA